MKKKHFSFSKLLYYFILLITIITTQAFFFELPKKTNPVQALDNVTKQIGTYDYANKIFTEKDTFNVNDNAVARFTVTGKTEASANKTDTMLAIDASGTMHDRWTSYRHAQAYDFAKMSQRIEVFLDAGYGPDYTSTSPEVIESAGDASESGGVVSTTGTILKFGTDWIGFRFPNVGIPQGETVQWASIVLRWMATDTSVTQIKVWGQKSTNAANFNSAVANDISNRTKTTAANTETIPNSLLGDYYDLYVENILQELVNQSGWTETSPAVFMIQPISGLRQVKSFDNSDALNCNYCVPQLTINYTNAGVPGTYTSSIKQQADDAEEDHGDADDNDIDHWANTIAYYDVGLRFQTVSIPRNATITSAKVRFFPQWESWGPSDFLYDLRIYGHDIASSPVFTETAGEMGSRTRTTNYVSWTPPEWDREDGLWPYYYTPDVKSVIQEIISRSDWNSGNNLSLLFTIPGDIPRKMDSAKSSAIKFLQLMDPTYDKVGALSYTQNSWRPDIVIESPLTSVWDGNPTDADGDIDDKIYALTTDGGTPLARAVSEAIDAVKGTGSRSDAKKYIILLTDGENSVPCFWWADCDPYDYADCVSHLYWYCEDTDCGGDYTGVNCKFNLLRQKIIDSKVVIYTIGMGNDVKDAHLKAIAESSNDGAGHQGKYFFAGDPQSLDKVYQEIASLITTPLKIQLDDTIDQTYFQVDTATGLFVTDGTGNAVSHNLTVTGGRITGDIGEVPDGEIRYIYVPIKVIAQNCATTVALDLVSATNKVEYISPAGSVIYNLGITNAFVNTCPVAPSAWFQTIDGDIHSNSLIKNTAVPATNYMINYSSATGGGIASSRCTIDPNDSKTSRRNWKISNYSGNNTSVTPTGCSTTEYPVKTLDYDWFYKNLTGSQAAAFPTAANTKIAANQDPSGIYLWSGSSVVLDTTILNTLKNKTANYIILVPGDLFITTSFTATDPPLPTSFATSASFIVKGNINIIGTVKNIYGLYLTNGNIDSAYTLSPYNPGTTDYQLNVFGGLFAGGKVTLDRKIVPSGDNLTKPAEKIVAMPKYFFTLRSLLGHSSQLTEWVEKY